MADVTDSKSVGSDTVRVQVPPSAPTVLNSFKDKMSGFKTFFMSKNGD